MRILPGFLGVILPIYSAIAILVYIFALTIKVMDEYFGWIAFNVIIGGIALYIIHYFLHKPCLSSNFLLDTRPVKLLTMMGVIVFVKQILI